MALALLFSGVHLTTATLLVKTDPEPTCSFDASIRLSRAKRLLDLALAGIGLVLSIPL